MDLVLSKWQALALLNKIANIQLIFKCIFCEIIIYFYLIKDYSLPLIVEYSLMQIDS
jgi:hypothetical protein